MTSVEDEEVPSDAVPAGFHCLTGTISFEPESGLVVYDDTHLEGCSFDQTECYQRTIYGTIGNWPGTFL